MRYDAFDKQAPPPGPNDIEWTAFPKQNAAIMDPSRVRGWFASKRGGKTEALCVDLITKHREKPRWVDNGRDKWTAGLVEPTHEMLEKILIPKWEFFAASLIADINRKYNRYILHDGSVVYLISGEKPKRIEGGKYSYIGIDECFQQKKKIYTESIARTSDTLGDIVVAGSLDPDIPNPKGTWVFDEFKIIGKNNPDLKVHEWCTADNPYFPVNELERLKNTLSPIDYKAMFTITWDVMSGNRVYDDFTEDNILESYVYNKNLPTYCAIDWGWAHPMAVGFYQRDGNRIILFDEIVGSKIKREDLYDRIMAKGYRISAWVCDLAGTQERESNISNVEWFRRKGIHMKYLSSKVLYGISVVRSYVLNNKGIRRFYITRNAPKHIDGMLNYSYQEKDGQILNENPLKKEDDCVDSLRYLFVNMFDDRRNQAEWNEHNRWDWTDAPRIKSS